MHPVRLVGILAALHSLPAIEGNTQKDPILREVERKAVGHHVGKKPVQSCGSQKSVLRGQLTPHSRLGPVPLPPAPPGSPW